MQPFPLPVDMIEHQCSHFPGAQAVRDQPEQNRVIALTRWLALLNHRKHPPHFLPGDRARNVRESIGVWGVNRHAQVPRQHLLAIKITEQHTQGAAQVANSVLPSRGLRSTTKAAGTGDVKSQRSCMSMFFKQEFAE